MTVLSALVRKSSFVMILLRQRHLRRYRQRLCLRQRQRPQMGTSPPALNVRWQNPGLSETQSSSCASTDQIASLNDALTRASSSAASVDLADGRFYQYQRCARHLAQPQVYRQEEIEGHDWGYPALNSRRNRLRLSCGMRSRRRSLGLYLAIDVGSGCRDCFRSARIRLIGSWLFREHSL